jgi:hypothetical protein
VKGGGRLVVQPSGDAARGVGRGQSSREGVGIAGSWGEPNNGEVTYGRTARERGV